MPQTRIRRLLRAEYRELIVDESLLVEAPFAETTRDGRGLREVALGLTASKLIVATDDLGRDNGVFCCRKCVDPSIESLRLRSLLPLECVKLSVFRERKRRALEARLIDGRAKYYELGGLGRCRARSWDEWCAQVSRLQRHRDDSEIVKARRQRCDGWTRKHLYLGPDYEELWDEHYVPRPVILAAASVESVKNDLIGSSRSANASHRSKKLAGRVSRFAEGVDEKCQHALYITLAPSSSGREITDRAKRISPKSHLHRGFGPWPMNFGDRVSLQSRLTQSLASIRYQQPEMRLPVSKRHLTRATASLACLQLRASTRTSALLFWTTDYWYRPRADAELYRDVRRHLDGQRNYSTTVHLRRLLKLHRRVTLCDISSTTLSRQLTLVDRELFTRVTADELRTLARQRDSRGAPNFVAWIAFAHRTTCLAQSEVLRISRVEERARILARLIRAAERCVDEGNFQSASSIVAALQSPAVHRLKATWTHLGSRHGTKYTAAMAKLSKLFANTEARLYREAWMRVEGGYGSSMPSIADVVARLLGVLGMRHGCAELDDEIDRLAVWLVNCQSRALDYDYPSESVAWEFLLKARYREDRENFALSFYLEP